MPNWLNQEIIYTYSVPLFVLVIVLELAYSNLRGLRLYALKDSLTSATFALSNLGLDMLFKGVSFAVLGWCFFEMRTLGLNQGVCAARGRRGRNIERKIASALVKRAPAAMVCEFQ